MGNCIHCGATKTGEEKFCVNCGAKLDGPMQTKKQLSDYEKKKRKIISISLLGLLLVGIGLHQVLNWTFDPVRKLTDMNEAFLNKDKEAFISYFNIPEDVAFNTDNFYQYIDDEGWEKVRSMLQEQIISLQEDGLSNSIEDSFGNEFISVTNNPVIGLYDRISFQLVPVELEVLLPLEDTTITIEGKTVTRKDKEQVSLGSFLPGSYTWEATVPSAYVDIKEQGEIYLYGDGWNKQIFSPDILAGTVAVSADDENAILFVNEKSTGKTIKELSTLGPIPYDGSVVLSAEAKDSKGKVVMGEKVEVLSQEAHITFAHIQEKLEKEREAQAEEEARQQFEQEYESYAVWFIDDFRARFQYALNESNFSYITNFFPIGSEVQATYMKEIENHGKIEGYYNYEFQSNTPISVKAIDSQTLYVETEEVFYFYSDEDNYLYNKTKGYTIILKDGELYIQDIEQLTTEKEIID